MLCACCRKRLIPTACACVWPVGISPEGVQRRVVEVLEGLSAPPPPPVNRGSTGKPALLTKAKTLTLGSNIHWQHSLQSAHALLLCMTDPIACRKVGTAAHNCCFLHAQALVQRPAVPVAAAHPQVACSPLLPSAPHRPPCSQQQAWQQQQVCRTGHTRSVVQATAAQAAPAAAVAAQHGAHFSTKAVATPAAAYTSRAQQQQAQRAALLCHPGHPAAPPSRQAAAAGGGRPLHWLTAAGGPQGPLQHLGVAVLRGWARVVGPSALLAAPAAVTGGCQGGARQVPLGL
jgi:hypothetical protein